MLINFVPTHFAQFNICDTSCAVKEISREVKTTISGS